jgi:hypothetical protein
MVFSEDERVALEAIKFCVDHIKGKAKQSLVDDEGNGIRLGILVMPAEGQE